MARDVLVMLLWASRGILLGVYIPQELLLSDAVNDRVPMVSVGRTTMSPSNFASEATPSAWGIANEWIFNISITRGLCSGSHAS